MSVHEKANPVQRTYQPEDYAYSVIWSEADQAYIGRVAEFASLAAHGVSPGRPSRKSWMWCGMCLRTWPSQVRRYPSR